MKRKLRVAMAVVLASLLVACQSLDVVGNGAVDSFSALMDAMPEQVGSNESNSYFVLPAPDGSARFFWRKNYRVKTKYDVMLTFPAKPFLEAGLDVGKLPAALLAEDMIVVGAFFGEPDPAYYREATPLGAFEQIVWRNRDKIKYHVELDHFGVSLGSGHMFEWAKDMSVNDKDIVFALNPDVFIDAGVDPTQVDGWVFSKVTIMDERGKKIEADRFLKAFDVK